MVFEYVDVVICLEILEWTNLEAALMFVLDKHVLNDGII